ncbi:MAG: glycosyltransferase 87 family protein [Planctomycetota bacterium]|nr:glycosyltransferase 87 family protein [Planctomycetota bacterium]
MSSEQHGPRPSPAMATIVILAMLSLAALVVALARMRIDRSATIEAGQANLSALWPFWIASACGWASLTALWMLLRRTAHRSGHARIGGSVLLILTVAIAARVAVLLTHEPALSDDVYRYVFDGRNAAAGINPYLKTPNECFGVIEDAAEDWPGQADLLPLINNPQLHTIYLPASQWVFASTGLAIMDDWSDPASSARVFRAVFIGFDLAVIIGLLIALARAGRSPWWAVLYAWHPLPIAEFAGSGHLDSLGIALLVGALLAYTKAPKKIWEWTVMLALGTLVKPVALPVAALLLKGRPWPAWARSLAIGGTVCLFIAGPLWLTYDAQPLKNMVSTAELFTLKWAHFGSVYEPMLWTIEKAQPQWTNDQQEVLARRLCIAMVLAVVVVVWLRSRDVWGGSRMILFAMVLLSPTAHPWYLLWSLALMPMTRSGALWIASLTLPWGYVVLGDVVSWSVSPWVMVAAYLPVYAALLFDAAKGLAVARRATRGSASRG